MSNELISLLVLVLIFVIGTTMPVNMGVLGIVAAFIVGTAMGVSEDDIFLGFPGDLFIILVGVTYLFGIASANGTVNWLVHASVRAVGGRVALIPWVFFLITAVLTASGAVVPGAVAIVVPIAIGFALTYGINPVLMGLMVINGATAGGFSPISVFGSIVNGVVEREDLAEDAAAPPNLPRLGDSRTKTADAGEMPELDRNKVLTLIGIATLIVVALAF